MAKTPEQELEEFADGYSPQQGSTIVVAEPTRQGGLPLGVGPSSAAAPVESPSPVPAFQPMPAPQGTPPGMPPGLPFAPQPPPAPGLQQLGGQVPDLTQLIQAQLMAPPRRPTMVGGIFDAIQAAGAGLMGQTPLYMQREAQEQEQSRHRLGQLMQLQQLQSHQQDRQMNAMTKAAELSIKFGELNPEDQDAQRPQFQALTSTILRAAGVSGFDEMVQGAYTKGNDDYRESLGQAFTDPLISEEERARYVQSLRRVKGEKERRVLTKDLIAEKTEQVTTTIEANLPRLVSEYREEQGLAQDAWVEQRAVEDFIRRKHPEMAASPIARKAWQSVVEGKSWDQTAAGMRVRPGSVDLEALKEQAKQEAQGPKFHNLDPYPKTLIPYMTDASGMSALQLDRLAATDPERFAVVVREAKKAEGAELLKRAREQGAEKALVPEKASAAEREKLTSDINNVQLAIEMQRLYKPAYVGPITGRTGAVRSDYTGALSEEEAQFRQSVTQFNNALIKELGGVVVPPAEFERIMAERPHLNLPPVTFEARAKQSRENMIFLAYVRRANMEKTGVDTSQLPPLPPLPKRFEGNPAVLGKTGKAPTIEAPAAPKDTTPPPVKRSGSATRVR